MTGGYGPGPLARALAWMAVVYLVLPITIVIPVSFTDQRFLSLPQDGLSLRHYENLLGSAPWLAAIGQSAMIALASTLHGEVPFQYVTGRPLPAESQPTPPSVEAE